MKSVMKHQFSQVPKVDIPRSTFNRTHSHKTTFDGGKLIPFYIDEVLPGDTFNVNATLFGRLATPIVPVMDNIFLDTHYFFVPNRLIWDNFQKFMGEQDNPEDSTDYIIPQVVDDSNTGFQEGTLEDYFGLPLSSQATGLSVNALWHRAYNLIWNEWFRDQNLQDSVTVNKGDGPDNLSSGEYTLLRRGKRHDYFTSALPWPQKGPGVEIPLATTADVDISNLTVGTPNNNNNPINVLGVNNQPLNTGFQDQLTSTGNWQARYNDWSTQFTGVKITNLKVAGEASVDLNDATAVTINTLREAFQLQRLAEKDARGGTRYTEIVRSHFSVQSPDGRLQRPEFLGGSTSAVNITPVAQTGVNPTVQTPLATLAATGTVASQGDGFTKSFTEHGVIIGLVSARADLTYQSGVNRMFSRRTKYDYYWPTLAHLGEQEILNKEIYAQGTTDDDGVFGYQERWAEYRYYPSKITGKMRSEAQGSLDVWHLSQDFANLPTLSETFIQDNAPLDRVIAVQDEPHFILDTHIQCRTARPMPTYSVPGLIDHF